MAQVLICLVLLLGIPLGAAEPVRPANWAQPLPVPEVINLHRLTPMLYRSAQPTHEGMVYLSTSLGIKTIINLRSFHNDRATVAGTPLLNEELAVKTWHTEDEDVIQVLRLVTNPTKGPFLIHCQFGSDRTGLMCAMYRIVEQGWTKEAAIDEMVHGGYGFHPMWSNIITYIRTVDVAHIAAAVHR